MGFRTQPTYKAPGVPWVKNQQCSDEHRVSAAILFVVNESLNEMKALVVSSGSQMAIKESGT